MGKPLSRFDEWAAAQAAAGAAERHLAQAASEHAQGLRGPPTAAEQQHALILRTKATAALMAVVSEVGGTVPDLIGVRSPPKPDLLHPRGSPADDAAARDDDKR